jgi:hypothetical protein
MRKIIHLVFFLSNPLFYRLMIVLLLLCISYSGLKALDTVSIKYFPLSVGNIYVYHWTRTAFPPQSGTIREYIVTDAIINNHRYYQYSSNSPYQNSWLRTDSVTGSLYYYTPNNNPCPSNPNDGLLDSLALRLGQSYSCNSNYITCTDTNTVSLFGSQWYSKSISLQAYPYSRGSRYVKFIGRAEYGECFNGFCYTETLLGCVLNGIVYGDTSIPTGIMTLNNNIPNDFSLSQNYPNPFNPKTNIKIDIPKSTSAKLIIYDILGREVATLVNEHLKPGTYEVDWDGSNYPSGVYFYRLTTEYYSETKKMVLIK